MNSTDTRNSHFALLMPSSTEANTRRQLDESQARLRRRFVVISGDIIGKVQTSPVNLDVLCVTARRSLRQTHPDATRMARHSADDLRLTSRRFVELP